MNIKKWFTLVELIITIAILAILWSIAFSSIKGYTKNSRDSVRIDDLSAMKKTLEIFVVQNGIYPEPSAWFGVTYSWAIAWTQGVFGESVLQNEGKLNKKPIDPLYQTDYTYSVTSFKTEYEIGGILEGSNVAYHQLVPNTNADTWYKALVKGNYNGKVLRVLSGSTSYILAVPWIITSDLWDLNLSRLISNKSIVYKNANNLPSTYSKVIVNWVGTGGFDFDPGSKLVLFNGNVNYLATASGKIEFSQALQSAYSGSVLARDPEFKTLLAFDANNDLNTSITFANIVIGTSHQFSKDLSKTPLDGANISLAVTAVDGSCGSANAQSFSAVPSSNLCSIWTISAISWTGPWSWTCSGSDGGMNANCTASLTVNGICWSGNGIAF